MKIYGVSASQVEQVLLAVSDNFYGGNLAIKFIDEHRRFTNFTLTVRKAAAPGGKRSNTGRKVAAACWHAHRDVIRALLQPTTVTFRRFPLLDRD